MWKSEEWKMCDLKYCELQVKVNLQNLIYGSIIQNG